MSIPKKSKKMDTERKFANGRRIWKAYSTLYVDGENFCEIGKAFEQSCAVRHAAPDNGNIAFMRQRELVDFAVDRIEQNRHGDVQKNSVRIQAEFAMLKNIGAGKSSLYICLRLCYNEGENRILGSCGCLCDGMSEKGTECESPTGPLL